MRKGLLKIIILVIGVLPCLAILITACSESKYASADLIIHNARVYTVNPKQPWAEAIAVTGGKISAIGSNTQVLSHKAMSTELIDARGAFIMPGFIEGHGHFPGLGESLQNLNLMKTRSWEEIVAAVADKVKMSSPGEWIIGRGWHQEKWDSTPGDNVLGYPYHTYLSAVSPENPVMLTHASGHAILANQMAMQLSGVTRETPDPKGGRIVRGNGSEAIGVFEENAEQIIEDRYREYLTTLSEEEIIRKWYEGIDLAQKECLRKGVTSFQDAGSSLIEVNRMKELAEKGDLDLRVWMMIRHTSDFLAGKLDEFPVVGAGNEFFTCRALKISIDGALGSYGAWLMKPYLDDPEMTGQNTKSLMELHDLAELAVDYGLQLCTHAIGDRANHEVLNVYEEVLNQSLTDESRRWRIEHAQHLDTNDIPRFAELGVITSMQGIHCTSDAPFVVNRLGEERARTGAYAWRSLLDHGAVVTNGTDAPVEDVNPIESFYATVTRKRVDTGTAFFPEQAMTREEAIHSYTLASAYAAFEEDIKGSLEAGKLADIVILSNDLLSCPEQEILNTHVLLTLVNGEIKYIHPQFQ